uniref:AAA+ ATPase domain-containing protein n=1 Tax=viral metagenome TaxID=1070528 RepID=A0A6C0DVA8_9ZZZZ
MFFHKFLLLFFFISPLSAISPSPSSIKYLLQNKFKIQEIPYNNLITNIDNKNIETIYISERLDSVISQKKDSNEPTYLSNSKNIDFNQYYYTKINPFIAQSILTEANENKVEANFLAPPPEQAITQMASDILNLSSNLILPSLVIYFIYSLFRFNQVSSGEGGMPGMPGLSKRVNSDKILVEKANITLNSFAGSPEIFEECTEVVSYLKNDTLYKAAGAEIPKGILLEGPPGTGKTLLAKAIASSADANFISIAASEFVELYVGMGASKVRTLFKKARDNKPCIIFIDEIDSVGRQRGAGINMANDEREQTLNQLLAEMDGFGDNEGVLIMAATNRRDVLDSALLRPGRFDRIIQVPLPNTESRKEIFKVHSKNKHLAENINFELIAELTEGFSGAEIKNLLNEAAIYASRRGEIIIQDSDLFNALDKLIVGLAKRTDDRSEDSKQRVAIHEAGHAFLTAIFKEYFNLKKVTIQQTYNGAGGYTLFSEYGNITNSGLYTKDLLWKRLLIGMGGKAAETVYYGDDFVSVGAVQDLKQTNSLAQRMIGNYGMGNKLEAFYNENVDDQRNPFLGRSLASSDKYSEKTKELFDKESLSLVNTAFQDAKMIIKENKEKMDLLVNALMANRTLTGKEVYDLYE